MIHGYEHQHDGDGQRADRLQHELDQLARQAEVDRSVIEQLRAEAAFAASQIDSLREGLTTARRIGAAVGYIMALERVSDVEAFERLRTASQDQRRKLREVAEDVLPPAAPPAAGRRPPAAPRPARR